MPTGAIKHGGRGFTLAELVVSVAITAVIGSAVAGLAMALSTASEHGRDRYLSLQTARIAMLNVRGIIRKAKLVTACDGTTMVLWAEDANGNGKINRTEVVLVGRDSSLEQIRMHRIVFPDHLPEAAKAALDIELELEALTDLNAVLSLLEASLYDQITVLAGDVRSFKVSVSPAAPMTELVGLTITVGPAERAVTLRTAVHLPAEVTDRVGIADDEYVLIPPES